MLKIGWPTYDPETNFFQEANQDFSCFQDDHCNTLKWTNHSWYGGNIEGLTPHSPVKKDTVNVAPGSYFVVRFKTDNPGEIYAPKFVEKMEIHGAPLAVFFAM